MEQKNYNTDHTTCAEIIQIRHEYYRALLQFHGRDPDSIKVGQYFCPRDNWRIGTHKGVTQTCRKVYPRLLKLIELAEVTPAQCFAALFERARIRGYAEPNLGALPKPAYVRAFVAHGSDVANSQLIASSTYVSRHGVTDTEALDTGRHYHAKALLARSRSTDATTLPGSGHKPAVGFWLEIADLARDAGMSGLEYVDFVVNFQESIKGAFPTAAHLRSPKYVERAKGAGKRPVQSVRSVEKIEQRARERIAENKASTLSRDKWTVHYLVSIMQAQSCDVDEAASMYGCTLTPELRRMVSDSMPIKIRTVVPVSHDDDDDIDLEDFRRQLEANAA